MATRWLVLFLFFGLAGFPLATGLADDQIKSMEGSGFGAFGTEAIKGYDEKKVQNDPICDRSKRPKILKVEPDTVKPGDSVVITGENFGKKECFRAVNFSKASKSQTAFTYVDETTVKATVPKDIPQGLTFVITITGGGSAQSKGVLVTK